MVKFEYKETVYKISSTANSLKSDWEANTHMSELERESEKGWEVVCMTYQGYNKAKAIYFRRYLFKKIKE